MRQTPGERTGWANSDAERRRYWGASGPPTGAGSTGRSGAPTKRYGPAVPGRSRARGHRAATGAGAGASGSGCAGRGAAIVGRAEGGRRGGASRSRAADSASAALGGARPVVDRSPRSDRAADRGSQAAGGAVRAGSPVRCSGAGVSARASASPRAPDLTGASRTATCRTSRANAGAGCRRPRCAARPLPPGAGLSGRRAPGLLLWRLPLLERRPL